MNRAAPAPLANMGEPAPRVDARQKVTGEARYASDFPAGNMAYGYLVTSSIARGRIARLFLDNARAVPGVLEIFTHENTGELKPVPYSGGGGGAATSMQKLGPEVHHDGQIVAMVVADTFEAAREAAGLVKIEYRAEQPSATFGSPGAVEADGSEVPAKTKDLPQAGDALNALAEADAMIDVA